MALFTPKRYDEHRGTDGYDFSGRVGIFALRGVGETDNLSAFSQPANTTHAKCIQIPLTYNRNIVNGRE